MDGKSREKSGPAVCRHEGPLAAAILLLLCFPSLHADKSQLLEMGSVAADNDSTATKRVEAKPVTASEGNGLRLMGSSRRRFAQDSFSLRRGNEGDVNELTLSSLRDGISLSRKRMESEHYASNGGVNGTEISMHDCRLQRETRKKKENDLVFASPLNHPTRKSRKKRRARELLVGHVGKRGGKVMSKLSSDKMKREDNQAPNVDNYYNYYYQFHYSRSNDNYDNVSAHWRVTNDLRRREGSSERNDEVPLRIPPAKAHGGHGGSRRMKNEFIKLASQIASAQNEASNGDGDRDKVGEPLKRKHALNQSLHLHNDADSLVPRLVINDDQSPDIDYRRVKRKENENYLYKTENKNNEPSHVIAVHPLREARNQRHHVDDVNADSVPLTSLTSVTQDTHDAERQSRRGRLPAKYGSRPRRALNSISPLEQNDAIMSNQFHTRTTITFDQKRKRKRTLDNKSNEKYHDNNKRDVNHNGKDGNIPFPFTSSSSHSHPHRAMTGDHYEGVQWTSQRHQHRHQQQLHRKGVNAINNHNHNSKYKQDPWLHNYSSDRNHHNFNHDARNNNGKQDKNNGPIINDDNEREGMKGTQLLNDQKEEENGSHSREQMSSEANNNNAHFLSASLSLPPFRDHSTSKWKADGDENNKNASGTRFLTRREKTTDNLLNEQHDKARQENSNNQSNAMINSHLIERQAVEPQYAYMSDQSISTSAGAHNININNQQLGNNNNNNQQHLDHNHNHKGQQEQQFFRRTPQNRTVVVGSRVELLCHVGLAAGGVQWAKDGFLLGYEAEIRGYPRFTMGLNAKKGIFNLRISNVTIEDEATYECQVGPARGHKPIKSAAQLTVIVPPRGVYLSPDRPLFLYSTKSHPQNKLNYKNNNYMSDRNNNPKHSPTNELKSHVTNDEETIQSHADADRDNLFHGKSHFRPSDEGEISSIPTTPSLRLMSIAKGTGERDAERKRQTMPPSDMVPTSISQTTTNPLGPVNRIDSERAALLGQGKMAAVQVREGERLKLTCETSSPTKPATLLRWYRNGVLINQDYYSVSVHEGYGYSGKLFHTSSVLQLYIRLVDNLAEYTCEATHSVNTMPEWRAGARGQSWETTNGFTSHANSIGGQHPFGKSVKNEPSGNVNGNSLASPSSGLDVETAQLPRVSVLISIPIPAGIPTIEGYKTGDKISAGESLALTCRSRGGNPPATLTWYRRSTVQNFKYNAKFTQSIEMEPSNVTDAENTGSDEEKFLWEVADETHTRNATESTNVLTFEPIDSSESGVQYKCEADNGVARPELSSTVIQFNVIYGAEHIKISGQSSGRPGRCITLACRSGPANPAPKHLWTIDGVTVDPVLSTLIPHAPFEGWITETNISYCIPQEKIALESESSTSGKSHGRGDHLAVCRSLSNDYSKILTETARIQVLKPPSRPVILGYNGRDYIKAGSHQTLRCISAGGNPLAELGWWRFAAGDVDPQNATRLTATSTWTYGNESISELIVEINRTEHLATYRCNAINAALDVPLSTQVTLHVQFISDDMFIDSSPALVGAGQTVTLTCNSGLCNPECDLMWIFSDRKIKPLEYTRTPLPDDKNPTGSMKSDEYGLTTTTRLSLNVTEEDDGKIVSCESLHDKFPSGMRRSMKLSVRFSPRFLRKPPIEYEVIEGSDLEMNLTILANPPVWKYSWSRVGDETPIPEVTPQMPSENNSLVPLIPNDDGLKNEMNFWSSGPILRSVNSSRSLTGTYRLFAENELGQVETQVRLNVLYAATISNGSDIVVVGEGETARLSCRVTGNPIPQPLASWTRMRDLSSFEHDHEMILSDHRRHVITENRELGTSELIVRNVSGAVDLGSYQCSTRNGIESRTQNSRILNLYLKRGPLFDVKRMKTTVGLEVGKDATVSCVAVGIPRVDFTWKLVTAPNGAQSRGSDFETSVTRLDQWLFMSQIFVSNVTRSLLNATLKCVASNEMGTNEAVIVLREKSRPDSVTGLFVFQNRFHPDTQLLLKWDAGWDGGTQQTFHIDYHKMNDTSADSNTTTVNHVETDDGQLDVKDLDPMSVYQFSVRAVNSLGSSSPILTKGQTGPPLDLAASESNERSIPLLDLFSGRGAHSELAAGRTDYGTDLSSSLLFSKTVLAAIGIMSGLAATLFSVACLIWYVEKKRHNQKTERTANKKKGNGDGNETCNLLPPQGALANRGVESSPTMRIRINPYPQYLANDETTPEAETIRESSQHLESVEMSQWAPLDSRNEHSNRFPPPEVNTHFHHSSPSSNSVTHNCNCASRTLPRIKYSPAHSHVTPDRSTLGRGQRSGGSIRADRPPEELLLLSLSSSFPKMDYRTMTRQAVENLLVCDSNKRVSNHSSPTASTFSSPMHRGGEMLTMNRSKRVPKGILKSSTKGEDGRMQPQQQHLYWANDPSCILIQDSSIDSSGHLVNSSLVDLLTCHVPPPQTGPDSGYYYNVPGKLDNGAQVVPTEPDLCLTYVVCPSPIPNAGSSPILVGGEMSAESQLPVPRGMLETGDSQPKTHQYDF